MSIATVLIFVILLQSIAIIQSYEYCKDGRESEICRKKKKHIYCHRDQIRPEGKFVRQYPNTDSLKKWMIFWHNHYRNEVACGRAKGKDGLLPGATKMRALSWDYELEYLAGVHAHRCKMEHDECRNTVRIPYSGQNLAYYNTTQGVQLAKKRGQHAIYKWFAECKDVELDILKKYYHNTDVKVGHFTEMSQDRVARVGCAITYCYNDIKHNRFHLSYITCNYDYTNVPGAAVYRFGTNASKCEEAYKVGRSSNFSCLCANTF